MLRMTLKLKDLNQCNFIHTHEKQHDNGVHDTIYTFLQPTKLSVDYDKFSLKFNNNMRELTLTEFPNRYELFFIGVEESYDTLYIKTESLEDLWIIIETTPDKSIEERGEYEKLIWLRDNLEDKYTYKSLKKTHDEFLRKYFGGKSKQNE